MKVLPFQIPKPAQKALIYQIDEGNQFYSQLHQHQEIQISLIVTGEGDLVVGDTVTRFAAGDLYVLGSHLPHLFRSDQQAASHVEMRSLFFTKESFGKLFFDLIELKELDSLFLRMEAGLRILEKKDELKKMLLDMKGASQLDQLIAFLEMLRIMARNESEILSSFNYHKSYSEEEGTRMSKVYNYAIGHFQRDISLDEIAGVATMTPNAFCRYFKQRTNKTFFEFIGELRIEYACRLLHKNNDLSISEISEKSGFRNLSNFNRQFRQGKGSTPTSFRKASVLHSEGRQF